MSEPSNDSPIFAGGEFEFSILGHPTIRRIYLTLDDFEARVGQHVHGKVTAIERAETER